MFFRYERGRERLHVLPIRDSEDPIRLDEARLNAWALALGEKRPSADQPVRRRPHRGMLPDVDVSRAVPAPRWPGLLTRLMRVLGAPLRRRAGAGA
jgi:hypothetical protein